MTISSEEDGTCLISSIILAVYVMININSHALNILSVLYH